MLKHTILPLLLALAVGSLAYRHFWFSDDSFIFFRVADNLLRGDGLRWNPSERVHVFTSPLWVLLVAPLSFFTKSPLTSALILSELFTMATAVIVFRSAKLPALMLLAAFLLMDSRCFIEYASSGLETPLTGILLALFFACYLQAGRADLVSGGTRFLLLYVAAWAFVDRFDTLVMLAPALALLVRQEFLTYGKVKALSRLLVSLSPAFLWLAFSLIYYGFLLPNTYYAKLSFPPPLKERVIHGAGYFLDLLVGDPLSAIVLLTALFLSVATGKYRSVSAGIALHLGYIAWTGGDYMGGRFFQPPFIVAALCLVKFFQCPKDFPQRTAVVLVVLVVYALGAPFSPLRRRPEILRTKPATSFYPLFGRLIAVNDEQATYFGAVAFNDFNPELVPNHRKFRVIKDADAAGSRCLIEAEVGVVGYLAGKTNYIIDPLGLTDPFLARRRPADPESADSYWGHRFRELPEGYVESCNTGENKIKERAARSNFETLKLITRGKLFSRERWEAIVKMHFSSY